jgi:hypothetical protein
MTSSSTAAGPNPAATVLRSEERQIRGAIRYGGVLLAIATGLAFFTVLLAAGITARESNPWILLALVIPCFVGIPGIRLIQQARGKRQTFVAVDDTGLWLHNSEGRGLIAWDALAALAVQRSTGGDGSPSAATHALDLCPKDTIDRDEAVLWVLVRDEEPLHPGLPRLRYRMSGPAGSMVDPLIDAVRKHAPSSLWAGEFKREPGYDAGPDHEGHRARTHGHTK